MPIENTNTGTLVIKNMSVGDIPSRIEEEYKTIKIMVSSILFVQFR